MDNLIDTSLGQYRIVEVIRRGGMSTVYKAHQETLDRYVAVKVLQSSGDPQFTARFKREARAIAQLQHPNILPIYDFGEQDGLLFLVLQYIEDGAAVSDLLGAPLDSSKALRLTSRVLGALDYAHRQGVIHRDIKPANILLSSPGWPMLADFGIAKLVGDSQRLTLPGLIIGTAAYMAPEQARGLPIDVRTDLYSVGVVLYELVTGRVPFEADAPVALLTKHAYEAPPPPRSVAPDLPPVVETILLRALTKDPDARYQTAADMAEACEEAVAWIEQSRVTLQPGRLYQPGTFSTQSEVAAPAASELSPEARQPVPDTRAPATPAPETIDELSTAQRGDAPISTGPGAARAEKRGRAPLVAAGVVTLLLIALALVVWPRLQPSATSGTPTIPSAAPPATAVAASTSAPPAATVAATAPPATAIPTSPPPTEVIPEPAGRVIFDDTFGGGAENSGLVGRQAPPDLTVGIDDQLGSYVMELAQPDQTRAVLLPRFVVADFSLQIDLSDGSADAGGGAAQGVIFRARDSGQFYALLINPREGTYAVRKYTAPDEAEDLVPWTESALIRRGDAVNQLRLDAAGDTFTIYLNGATLDGFSDTTYPSGMVGTIVANVGAPASTMRFDNLRVWSADPAPPAPDLAATLPGRGVSGDMVLVPGGAFVMGSNDDPAHLPHVVEVEDFYMDRREVTNLAYLACLDTFGCVLPAVLDSATRQGYHTSPQFNSYPVVNVTWQQARDFCERMDKRLATEAEWEKAAGWMADARAKLTWPWGNVFDPARLNSAESERGDTTQVGQFRAGLYGTVDMAGNVAEWTSSLDAPYPYDAGDGRENAETAGERVVRGGSWAQPAEETTTYARQAVDPDSFSDTIGFRCAATP